MDGNNSERYVSQYRKPADLLLEVLKNLTMVSRADLVGRLRRGKLEFVMNRKKSKEKIDFQRKSKNRNEKITLERTGR